VETILSYSKYKNGDEALGVRLKGDEPPLLIDLFIICKEDVLEIYPFRFNADFNRLLSFGFI